MLELVPIAVVGLLLYLLVRKARSRENAVEMMDIVNTDMDSALKGADYDYILKKRCE